jgi:hypothetical protein
MDEIRDYVKQNKPDSERQMAHTFSAMQNPDIKRQRHESVRGTIWEEEGE